MYDSKHSKVSPHKKTRQEIENEHSERILIEECEIPHVEEISYGYLSFFPQLPLLNLDRYHQDDNIHPGDHPLDYIESEPDIEEATPIKSHTTISSIL